jgi:hypothetical protein
VFKDIAMITCARLDYLHDTLLGPVAKSAVSDVVITPITPGAIQVHVLSPVPDDLHKAHSLIITISPKERLIGTVVHSRKMLNGDLELQLDL